MDTARSASRRPGSALALSVAMAMAMALSVLSPALAAPQADAGPLVRVVVTSTQHALAGVAAAVQAAGGTVLDALPLVGGVSADLPHDAVLAPSYIVAQDRPMTLEQAAVPAGPVSTVRQTVGLGAPAGEGSGVKVAVVDTGVADVPDLAGRLTHLDVSGAGRGDGYGHGTFVAGLIAGDGSSSGGAYAGVAPGAEVLDIRVAGDDGSSSLVRVLRGLQAAADDPEVDVVNLSLSSGSPLPYQLDPLTRALEQLWIQGVVVVVPAGNAGADGGVSSPGLDPVLLTVGGLAEAGTSDRADDTVASWSSRGPAAQGVAKPDLVAPGASLISTVAEASVVAAAQTRTDLPAGYAIGSGTSFSTAVTSGAAAVLLGQRDLEPDQVKNLVTGTAYQAAALGDRNAAGAGGLDLAAALAAPTPPVHSQLSPVAGPPGQDNRWSTFLLEVLNHDAAAAEQTWAKLPKKHQEWADALWADSSDDVKAQATVIWSALGWSEADGAPDRWQRRIWAASNWAASNWAANSWSANSWSASNWAASNWAASNWAANSWSASNWAASNWAASNWAASNWAAANSWSANSWSASNWAASNWG